MLALLHPGAVLGLTAAFLKTAPVRKQNWVAHSSVALWRIPVEDFRDCCSRDSAMAETMLDSLASRVQWLMDEVAAAAILPARCKVIRCLLGFNLPPEPAANPAHSSVRLTQAKLAQMLGLTRLSVANVLMEL